MRRTVNWAIPGGGLLSSLLPTPIGFVLAHLPALTGRGVSIHLGGDAGRVDANTDRADE